MQSPPKPEGSALRDADWKSVELDRALKKQMSLPPIAKSADPTPSKPKKLISSDEDSDGSGSESEKEKEKALPAPQLAPEPVPVIPELTFAEREIYFGDRARAAFFDAYRHISRQQAILSGIAPGVRGVDVLSKLGNTTFEELAERNSAVRCNRRSLRVSMMVTESPDIFDANDPMGVISSSGGSRGKSVVAPRGFITQRGMQAQLAQKLSRNEQLKLMINNKSVADAQHQALQSTLENRLGMSAFRRCDSMMVDKKAQETHLTRPDGGADAFLRPGSPRTRYLTGCLKHSVAPRPNLIIRKDITSVINIEYQYIGDTMAVILANSLEGLPYVTELNVAGNKLTDVGLTALITALPSCPTVDTVSTAPYFRFCDLSHDLSAGELLREQDRCRCCPCAL